MKTEYAPFDASSHLDNEEVIAEYLTAAAEDEDPNVLLAAIANVAKARGMARVAQAAGLGRESLYKTLAPGSHPRFETIRAILRALDVEIAVRAPLTDNSGEKSKATAEKREVMTEARRLVKEVVMNELHRAKVKISHVPASKITAAANVLIDGDPSFIEQAKANLAEPATGDRLKAGPMASPRLAEEIIKRMKAPREEPVKSEPPAKSAKEIARVAQSALAAKRRQLRQAAKPAKGR